MKKNFLGFTAVVIAALLSSFSVRFNTVVYFDFISGPHSASSSYTVSLTPPPRSSGTSTLDWISIESADAMIVVAEFNKAFDALDTDLDNSLDDETEGVKTFKYPLPTSPSYNTELEKQ